MIVVYVGHKFRGGGFLCGPSDEPHDLGVSADIHEARNFVTTARARRVIAAVQRLYADSKLTVMQVR